MARPRSGLRLLKPRSRPDSHSRPTSSHFPQGVPVRVEVASHSFGNLHVLDEIVESVQPGEFVSILGPSGCGKSTLLRIIGGLVSASAGRVLINSTEVRGPSESVGMVFQEDALLEWRTVLGNVMLPLEIKHLPIDEGRDRAYQLLRQVDLDGFLDSRPSQLSGGMKQRVAICQALVHEPPLLLMDEPFGALDALTRQQMQIDLEALWARMNTTVLFVTHSIPEAVLLSDRVIVMSPRPARILGQYRLDFPRPRSGSGVELSPEYLAIADSITRLLKEVGVLRDARQPSMDLQDQQE